MKLHRTIIMQEMTGPIPLELTLGEIIGAGDVTNHYQILTLAILSDFFRSGLTSTEGQLDGIINLGSDATSVAVIETIKALSPAEKTALATYLRDCVKIGNCSLHDAKMSSTDWINFVLQKQD